MNSNNLDNDEERKQIVAAMSDICSLLLDFDRKYITPISERIRDIAEKCSATQEGEI